MNQLCMFCGDNGLPNIAFQIGRSVTKVSAMYGVYGKHDGKERKHNLPKSACQTSD